jgi:outer membrane lipoprotein SlyB
MQKSKEERKMNTPLHPLKKSGTHPVMMVAGVAVILFCATGTAAIMGWIPTSIGRNNNADSSVLTKADQLAAPAALPVLPVLPAHQAPVHTPAHTAPVHPVTVAEAAPVRTWCANCGVIESIHETTTRAQGSGVGAAGGAVVGGLLGNQVGGGHGRDVMTVVGAIGGAVAGNQIEGQVKATHSYEIRVRLDDGSSRTVHQSTPPSWRNGDHVKIVDGGLRSNR